MVGLRFGDQVPDQIRCTVDTSHEVGQRKPRTQSTPDAPVELSLVVVERDRCPFSPPVSTHRQALDRRRHELAPLDGSFRDSGEGALLPTH